MLVSTKQIYVLSNGSITFSYGIKPSNKQHLILEKDSINAALDRKNLIVKVTSDISKKYKNKYFK